VFIAGDADSPGVRTGIATARLAGRAGLLGGSTGPGLFPFVAGRVGGVIAHMLVTGPEAGR
jgi:hypothetical protein